MTLRETIADIIRYDLDVSEEALGYRIQNAGQVTTEIIAAIREHVTTEEALDRAAAAYWSDGDLVADIGDVLKKAILAALGGE